MGNYKSTPSYSPGEVLHMMLCALADLIHLGRLQSCLLALLVLGLITPLGINRLANSSLTLGVAKNYRPDTSSIITRIVVNLYPLLVLLRSVIKHF